MRARLLAALLALALAVAGAPARPAAAADEAGEVLVADIVVEGGVTVTADTVAYYLGLGPGDPFDAELVAEGFHQHINKGYIYFAMFFALAVEVLNLRLRAKTEKVALRSPYR